MTQPARLFDRDIALFLDVDGTLLEIATTPDSVQVAPALRSLLQQLREHEQGALALISGRSIRDLDALFAPCVFPAAGQHGLERRDAKGRWLRPDMDRRVLQSARRALRALQQTHSGVLMEDKGDSLAVHYRLAPQARALVEQVMSDLQAQMTQENGAHRYGLRYGKSVIELAPLRYSKGTAIEIFMSESPFAGRTPVFIGDDLTDEEGFMAVNGLGGYSIRVGPSAESAARFEFADVAAVLTWLHARNDWLLAQHNINQSSAERVNAKQS